MGEAKRRKNLDPTYGQSKYYIPKSSEDYIEKCFEFFGGLVRFYVWKNKIYAGNHDGNIRKPIVPYQEASQYSEQKELMDVAAEDLEGREDGAWVISSKLTKWTHLPLSFSERLAIAPYDENVLNNLPSNLPMAPVLPLLETIEKQKKETEVKKQDFQCLENPEKIIDDLFDGQAVSSSMVAAINSALNKDPKNCEFCIRQAFSWSGYVSISERKERLEKAGVKLRKMNSSAATILQDSLKKVLAK
ncbi:MAG: hypothetical protein KME30_17225 [Iphinoe sp. HA4291-MV1]|jgi:hypothetical protein|nr:hypothetical protein [Iphinoe sp. HA4291-MV1]